MIEWIQANKTLLLWLAIASGVLFAAALVIVPWAILQLPADYFADRKRHVLMGQVSRSAWLRLTIVVGKNILGGVLVLLGIVMLVTPGQGLVTIAVGLMLMNFPGKYRFERWLISRGPLLKIVNRFRQKHGREGFIRSPSNDESSS